MRYDLSQGWDEGALRRPGAPRQPHDPLVDLSTRRPRPGAESDDPANAGRGEVGERVVLGDQGAALILVVGIAGIVFAMVTTGIALAVAALGQSRHRSNFEQALVTAEAGVDQTLARLQFSYDNATGDGGDFPVPGTQAGAPCVDTPVDAPSGSNIASAAAEESWARQQLADLRGSHPECVVTTESGEYLVLKPKSQSTGPYRGYGRIYSIGWSPAHGASEAAERLVKAEYIFMPFKPAHAVLAGGDMRIESSAMVTVAAGFDEDLAGVHSNGTITTEGNPEVFGPVTSTESSTASSNRFHANPNGQVRQAGNVSVPTVNAAAFYRQAPNMDSLAVTAFGFWHDLCPDGTVRAYATNAEPCSNTVQYEGLTGVTYDSVDHEWTINRDAPIGVYYAHHADVTNGNGNASFANLTVVASAENPTDCADKRYGNVSWDHYDMRAPAVTNLFLYADADLVTDSNFAAGNSGYNGSAVQGGMFVAGDQLSLNTGSQSVVGAALAADQCDSGPPSENVIKNMTLYYDPQAKSPFTSIINQTLWLEY